MTNQNTDKGEHMEPIQLANGRFVCFGHEVVNFGQRAVVVGSRDLNGEVFLTVRGLDSAGKMQPGSWYAKVGFCK